MLSLRRAQDVISPETAQRGEVFRSDIRRVINESTGPEVFRPCQIVAGKAMGTSYADKKDGVREARIGRKKDNREKKDDQTTKNSR